MTQDLGGSPICGVWPPHEDSLALAPNRGGEIFGGAGHTAETLL
jgi:hypothetical protein